MRKSRSAILTKKLDPSVDQRFSSSWGLLLSVLGIAVGTGNIWRFPRIVAQNGGENGAGTFLIAWIFLLFLWSIPLIIAEYALGRKFRNGVVGTFSKAAGEKFTWMGAFVGFVSAAINFFYSVVVGWCIYYFIYMLTHHLPLKTTDALAIWDNYQSSNWPILFHAVAMGFGAMAVWKGVQSIEKVNKVMIPTLLLIVVFAVIRALSLPGSWDGVKYLLTPQWSQLVRPRIWLEALIQNAWDTGAGWGLFLTYAAYMKREQCAVKNAFGTGIGNNVVSLFGALMIFGTVFAVCQTEMGMSKPDILKLMKESGPASTGLTFIWMPQLFARMFMGHPLSVLFFLGLTFAGFSSMIAHIELPVRVFVDAGFHRSRSIGLVVALSFLLGIPSAKSLNILSNQDFVWGVALMLSGAFVAFGVIKNNARHLRTKDLADPNDWKLGFWWEALMKFAIPVASVILLIWWLSQSAMTEQWWNPLNAFSIATCLMQWTLILIILFLLNRWMSNNLVPGSIHVD